METLEIQGASLITIIRLDEAEPPDASTQSSNEDASSTPAPVNILIDLQPGMTIHKEPLQGDIPFVIVESGRTKVNFGINADEASKLTEHHLDLVDQLADSFCWLRDQVRRVAPNQAGQWVEA